MRFVTRGIVAAALLVAPAMLPAQGAPGERAEQLRERIERMFANRLRQDLGLGEAEAQQVGAVLAEWGDTRRQLEQEERTLRRALDGQLRPGVAANSDSLTRLIDRLLRNRVEYAESFQGEMRALVPILSPVQRAQFLRLRDQILQRVRELQEQRPGVARPGRPGGP